MQCFLATLQHLQHIDPALLRMANNYSYECYEDYVRAELEKFVEEAKKVNSRCDKLMLTSGNPTLFLYRVR